MRRRFSVLLAVLVVGAAAAGTLYMWRPDLFARDTQSPVTKEKAEYYCPMHPQQRSDQPDDCPICKMKMVKLEKGGPAAAAEKAGAHDHQAGEAEPGSGEVPTIFLSPERQQLIGVRTAVAQHRPLSEELRSVGKVAFDETKVTHIHTKISGFIEEVFADFIGKQVRRGQPLFTIYSPELVATQEEFLLALRSNKSLKDSSFPWVAGGSVNLIEAARKRLQLWDITDQQIDELERTGKVKRALTVYSPVDGVVTQRAAYHHGKYVTPDTELFTIVDMSTVWVLGQVYEHELSMVRVGQTVQVEFPQGAGVKTRPGTVSFLSPTLDPKTRTTEVRVELKNPDLTMRPDMFVTFKSRVNYGSPLTIPTDAVLDTGTERYVFVDRGQGYFEPRSVTVGQEADGFQAIERGLKEGERVATAANFLLDSESRLKGALSDMGVPAKPDRASAGPAAEGLRVQILEPKRAKSGLNQVRLLLRDTQGQPVTDAEVEIRLFMPQMGSMPPMRSAAKLRPAGGGQYAGEIEIPMAWTWETTVTAKKDGRVTGSAKTTITAR